MVQLEAHHQAAISATSVVELAECFLQATRQATGADVCIFGLTDNLRGRCVGAFSNDAGALLTHMPVYEDFWAENPLGQRTILLGDDQTRRLEDAIERRSLERGGYYNEFLRPAGIDDVMTGYMKRRGNYRLALTAMRSTGRFTPAERNALEAIRLSTVTAFRNFVDQARLMGHAVTIADLINSDLTTAMIIRDCPHDDEIDRSFQLKPLTATEKTVLHWLIMGKSNPEIATAIGCAPRTVGKHVEHLFDKLSVDNRTSAVVRALQLRLNEECRPSRLAAN